MNFWALEGTFCNPWRKNFPNPGKADHSASPPYHSTHFSKLTKSNINLNNHSCRGFVINLGLIKNLLFFVCFWTDLGLGCILLSIRDLAPFIQFGVLPNLQYGHNILHWGVIQHSYLYLLVRLLVTSWQQVVIMANRLFNVCIYAMIASLGSENMILCIMVVFVLNSFEIWVLRRICLKGDRLFTNSGKK